MSDAANYEVKKHGARRRMKISSILIAGALSLIQVQTAAAQVSPLAGEFCRELIGKFGACKVEKCSELFEKLSEVMKPYRECFKKYGSDIPEPGVPEECKELYKATWEPSWAYSKCVEDCVKSTYGLEEGIRAEHIEDECCRYEGACTNPGKYDLVVKKAIVGEQKKGVAR